MHTATAKIFDSGIGFVDAEPRLRFGLLLVLVTTLHAFVIWGVEFRFNPQEPPTRIQRSIEVTLIRQPPAQHIDPKPDFLAEVKAIGGGREAEQPQPPRHAATSPPRPIPTPVAPRVMPLPPRQNLKVEPGPHAESPPLQPPVVKKPERVLVKAPTSDSRSPMTAASDTTSSTTTTTEKFLPSASQLLASTKLEAARLSAELDRHQELQSTRQRRKHISASTQEYKYAAYLEEWRLKVERIGNLNYPEEAKKRKLYGHLVLTVALRPDGSLENIRLIRSSGEKLLDEAAIGIVKLTAPFAPFPPDIRKEADILEITRTWQFLSSNRLFARD